MAQTIFLLITPIITHNTVYDPEPLNLPTSFSYRSTATCIPSRSTILEERPMVYGHTETEFTGTYHVSRLHYFEDCGSVKKGNGRIVPISPEVIGLFPDVQTCGKCLRRRVESMSKSSPQSSIALSDDGLDKACRTGADPHEKL